MAEVLCTCAGPLLQEARDAFHPPRRRVAGRIYAGTPRRRESVPCTNGWKVHASLQPPRRSDTRHLRCGGWNATGGLFHWNEELGTLVLHEHDHELRGLRLACVAPDGVNVIGAFIEGVAGLERQFLAALDTHHDRAFEHV